MTVYYLDHENGVDANAGTSFATRKKNMSALPTIVAVDEIRVIASPDPFLLGDGLWTDGDNKVTFATPFPVKVIEDGAQAWFGSTNVTPSAPTAGSVDGLGAINLSILSAFTTGKAAYKPVGDVGTPAISAARSPALLGAAALTQLVSANGNSVQLNIPLPFDILFNGVWYNSVSVSDNSILFFGNNGSTADTTTVATPAILIGAASNSWQRLYAGAENSGDTFRVRYEGTNATSGTPGSPTIVWEVTFSKTNPGTIKVDIGTNTYIAAHTSAATLNRTTTLFPFTPDSNTGYDITQSYAALDLSAYDTISFPFSGSMPMNAGYVALCSDMKGDTVVHQIPLTGDQNATSVGVNTPVTFTVCLKKFGAALANSIKSIAYYMTVDSAAVTLLLDNLIATTAASGVDHTMLLGKKTTAEPWFFNLKAITPNALMIGHHTASGTDFAGGSAAASRPYAGATETVPSYGQKTMFVPYLSTERTPPGTLSWASVTGGWNRTDMSTRTGRTFVRMWGGSTAYIVNAARSVTTFMGITMVNFGGPLTTGTIQNIDDVDLISGNVAAAFTTSGTFTVTSSVKFGYICQCSQVTLHNGQTGSGPDYSIGAVLNSSSTLGAVTYTASTGRLNVGRPVRPIQLGLAHNNYGYGVSVASERKWKGTKFTSNRLGEVYVGTDNSAEFLETDGLENVGFGSPTTTYGMVQSKDGIWTAIGNMRLQGAVVHASSSALMLSPTNVVATALRPAFFSLAQVAAAAGVPITFKAWGRRDNVGLSVGIMIAGGNVTGIETDQTDLVTAAANTWEELSITVTPTVDGVIEVFGLAYGGTTYKGYLTELTWET